MLIHHPPRVEVTIDPETFHRIQMALRTGGPVLWRDHIKDPVLVQRMNQLLTEGVHVIITPLPLPWWHRLSIWLESKWRISLRQSVR